MGSACRIRPCVSLTVPRVWKSVEAVERMWRDGNPQNLRRPEPARLLVALYLGGGPGATQLSRPASLHCLYAYALEL
jgi:hypothetical protein